MIKRRSILFARTCAHQLEHPEVTNWLMLMGMQLTARSDVFELVDAAHHTEHRIHCGRNELAKMAVDRNFDFLCFVDGDMHPDFRYLHPGKPRELQPAGREWAKPFLESSFKHMLNERCGVIGAPAVTGPPGNLLNVFLQREDGDAAVSRMTHDEYRNTPPCMKQVAAVGTGLMLIDVEVFRQMPKPWFQDAYTEGSDQTSVRLSQDCAFCLKCCDLGFPVFANLYAPAGHIKFARQEPPEPVVFS